MEVKEAAVEGIGVLSPRSTDLRRAALKCLGRADGVQQVLGQLARGSAAGASGCSGQIMKAPLDALMVSTKYKCLRVHKIAPSL